MLALIFVRAAMPMPIGWSPFAKWTLLAGMTIRPRATSSRTSSGSSCSSRATASISAVTRPARACSIWVIIGSPGVHLSPKRKRGAVNDTLASTLACLRAGVPGNATERNHYESSTVDTTMQYRYAGERRQTQPPWRVTLGAGQSLPSSLGSDRDWGLAAQEGQTRARAIAG